MTITHLKRGKPEAERSQDDAKVRAVVEATLADIEARGDAAVRELSQKFDGYAPPSFRLEPSQIEAAMRTARPLPPPRIAFLLAAMLAVGALALAAALLL